MTANQEVSDGGRFFTTASLDEVEIVENCPEWGLCGF